MMRQVRAEEVLLGGEVKICYRSAAFVGLVKPLDSFRGAAGANLRPFSVRPGGAEQSVQDIK
jgi:hypothetical protein